MSKWREDRMYEIMNHLRNDSRLNDVYQKEMQKSERKYPKSEFFIRMEKCYEKALKKYESIRW